MSLENSQYDIIHPKGDLTLDIGNNYFVGDGFIARVSNWADRYDECHTKIWRRNNENIDQYMEAKNDLLKRKSVYLYEHGFESFFKMIGGI